MLLIPALNIVGILLVFLGMKSIAKRYQDNRIYRNATIGTILGIFGLIEITSLIITLIYAYIFTPTKTTTILSDNSVITQTGTYQITALGVIMTFSLILLMALFYRSTFNKIAVYSGKPLFRPAGNMLLIGAIIPLLCTALLIVLTLLHIAIDTALVLTIGVSFGLIVTYIAFILMAIAFSSLKQAITA
ncbi:DUF996 domain-containing protein [Candidatus Bathycorpusculum sp.]|uniref:DUF996 domain-containing protein n=1 Tax=Candidatus Bathycorpusculum sp. TaxID=2994959 RepID=UPI002817E4E1|nr:DUF996 domain-containing protein [Candidatus Termitimicrobium sp.]MCL2432282.1 DUF996 domain-containing protein [Candidatus Termitimicrobium sp.]